MNIILLRAVAIAEEALIVKYDPLIITHDPQTDIIILPQSIWIKFIHYYVFIFAKEGLHLIVYLTY